MAAANYRKRFIISLMFNGTHSDRANGNSSSAGGPMGGVGGGGGGDTLAKSNTYQDYGDVERTKGSPAHSSPTQNRENII